VHGFAPLSATHCFQAQLGVKAMADLLKSTAELARKYKTPVLVALIVAWQLSPSKHQQNVNRDTEAKAKAKDRKIAYWARFKSLFWALRSKTLRNMVLSSALGTLIANRTLGIRVRRSFPLFLSVAWALLYKWNVVETPRVFYRRTFWNTHIVEKSKIAQTEFWPVFWLFNRHAQTVICFALSALEWIWAPEIHYARETIPCHDEPNEQFIDWAHYSSVVDTSLPGHGIENLGYDVEDRGAENLETPVVICVHGLGDHRDIPYVKRFARLALRNGWRVAVWSWWKFDLADSRDLKLVVDHIHQRFPRAPLVGIGWSAGVYSLTQYLQKAGADTPLVAAVCQSGCLDFPGAVSDVTSNENTTYPLFLLGQAHKCIYRHVSNDKRITDKSKFDRLIIEELDPMNLFDRFYSMIPEPQEDMSGGYARDGFVATEGTVAERVKNAAHYSAKVIDHMDKIKVTTLLLHSEDDPIVSSEHVNWGKIETNRHIIVAHTHRGGHCAWHEGLVPFGDTWGDRVSCNFISSIIESQSLFNFIVELVRKSNSAERPYASTSLNQGGLGQNQGHAGRGVSPRFMARICSVSDLATMSKSPSRLSIAEDDY